MIEDLLEEAASSENAQSRSQIIRELARYPDKLRSAIANLLKKRKRYLYPVTAQVIHKMGYPGNAALFRLLLDYVGDKNSPVWQEAVQLLVTLGVQEVTPHLIKFVFYRDDHQYWGDDVEGVCSMLCTVDREFAMPCGPVIAHILGKDDLPPPHDLDKGFLLDVLEKIGAECAEYALPALLDLLSKEGTSDIGQQTWRLVVSFDKEALEPYQYLLADLQQSDSSL